MSTEHPSPDDVARGRGAVDGLSQAASLSGVARALDPSVRTVRVLFPDLHGIARGTEVPIAEIDRVAASGLGFCTAVMSTDLDHTPVLGAETGFPDLVARPDPATALPVPWEPGVVACLADLAPTEGGPPIADPRGAVRRAVERFADLGLVPMLGPELEFFLLARDPSTPGGARRRVDRPSLVYTVGPQVDPDGVVRGLAEQLSALGLGALASNHEFGRDQYEISLRHSDALGASDDALRVRASVKDVAALRGLVATFMGKPFNDEGGSGTHLHLSFERGGANVLADPDRHDGLAPTARHAIAGILHHAPALLAILNPTINAFRRLRVDALAPSRADWGHDDRFTFVRVPPGRGAATRLEVRAADGATNVHLAVAALLTAAEHGVRDGLQPPAPTDGGTRRGNAAPGGASLPGALEDALDALEADPVLRDGLGAPLIEAFVAMKREEVARHRAWVSDWELREYLLAL